MIVWSVLIILVVIAIKSLIEKINLNKTKKMVFLSKFTNDNDRIKYIKQMYLIKLYRAIRNKYGSLTAIEQILDGGKDSDTLAEELNVVCKEELSEIQKKCFVKAAIIGFGSSILLIISIDKIYNWKVCLFPEYCINEEMLNDEI